MTRIAATVLAMAFSACAAPQEAPVKDKAKRENRLAREKSPYLLQHRHNPVDWYPWGDEAFAKAKEQNKPVFLSIGYSTCHWCHVMERESFESEEVAAMLNERFISIKVDREERPDVDAIYMAAAVAMTGHGGWPLSVFLDHERLPFFAGTYFPPEDAHGRPGFKTLITRLHELWRKDREKLLEGGRELRDHIAKSGDRDGLAPLKEEYLDRALNGFRSQYDGERGGFGGAPKFPRTVALEFLLRMHARQPDSDALPMVRRQLDAMMRGGIYDHLGGGFHRYSTDAQWLVPHFEKMLYDNALIPRAYLQAWQATGEASYVRVIRETCDYVLRDMTSPLGGFYSAEDADSEGFEGTFYLWTPAKLKAVVPGRDGDLLCRAYGVVEGGNWVPHEPREPRGNSVVHRAADSAELAAEFKLTVAEVDRILEDGRRKLFDARARRVRPHLDDKVLVEWNGMMIGTLAAVGAALEEPRYLAAADKAADFILSKMRRGDGRLLRRWRDGESAIPAFLDDYASFIEGLIELYQATFNPMRLNEAVALGRAMLELFADPRGGFFMTGKDAETMIARTRETYDGAMPSGNSVAAHVLLRLAEFTGEEAFAKAGRATVERSGQDLALYGPAYPHLLSAMESVLSPWREIVIAGDSPEMWRAVRRRFLPNTIFMAAPAKGAPPDLMKRYPVLEGRTAIDGQAAAYVCRNRTCAAPVTKVEDLAALLDAR